VFTSRLFIGLATAVCLFALSAAARSQTTYERLRGANASMNEVQPVWMGPLIQSDARLSQAVRLSVSNATEAGAHPISYGNSHGVNFILYRRFQVDFDPPSFFRDHAAAQPDGFGNAGAQIKCRIASGNADHGNFAVSAVLYHAFAPGVTQNLMQSAFNVPSIAVGKAFGRFTALTTVGGVLPAGKIAIQGRAVEWNLTAQLHSSAHTWFDIENNSLFFRGGQLDGKTQNFLTPAGFYMYRRKDWSPRHASFILDGGMQIATSRFHCYNHNLITELRILF
jgi:hypothetical protein